MIKTEEQDRKRTFLKGGLTASQREAFVCRSQCPMCSNHNIIRRLWRDDWFCGWCKEVFKKVGRKIVYVGNQDFID
jgi:ribosomal protein L37AE/L43A